MIYLFTFYVILILFLGQNVLFSQDDTFANVSNKKRDYEYDETDFLGLDFFEKKSYKGAPPGLAPVFEPSSDEDFPEVEIIVGDPSKFGKSRPSTETQPVDDSESEKSVRATTSEPNEDVKLEKAPPSTVAEPEEDEDEEVYKPTVRSWGMFPRPQNISKAVRCSYVISQHVFVFFMLPDIKGS
jgi:hypothetical protein